MANSPCFAATADEAAALILKNTPSTDCGRVIIGIDGRCASGKTTVAARLSELTGCVVIHADDYFLRPVQRTAERYAQPGGNLDRERLADEALSPLAAGADTVSLRRFDCASMTLGDAVLYSATPLVVVEGSYCCHPDLQSFYTSTVFLTTSRQNQLDRLRRRGSDVKVFESRWLVLEEDYFSFFGLEDSLDLTIRT